MTQEEREAIVFKIRKFGLLQFRGYDSNDYLINSLEENKIIFGSRKNFNDPFDCNLPINVQCSIIDVENLLLDISFKKNLFDLGYIRKRADEIFSDTYKLRAQLEILIYNYRRFSCFTIASPNKHLANSKFWANYANKHKGICMKFNGDILIDYSPNERENFSYIPVEYCTNDAIPKHNYIKDKSFRGNTSAQYFLGTKSMEWKDEEEIRLVYFPRIEINDDFVYREFNPKYLEQIYLGCNLEKADIETITYCLNNPKYKHVDVFQLERDERRFKLNDKLVRQGKKS